MHSDVTITADDITDGNTAHSTAAAILSLLGVAAYSAKPKAHSGRSLHLSTNRPHLRKITKVYVNKTTVKIPTCSRL